MILYFKILASFSIIYLVAVKRILTLAFLPLNFTMPVF